MSTDSVPLSICTDCLMLLANGEVFDAEGNDLAEAHSVAMTRLWPTEHITLGGEVLGFSMDDCDGCGSRLGGDRYTATAWVDSAETDDDVIADNITRAHAASVVIDDATARAIASQYHGGQTSALYSFTSTGAITEETKLAVDHELEDEIDTRFLRALRAYVVYWRERGPVDGWSRLWVR